MKNNQKGFASLVLVGVIVVLVALGGYFVWSKKSTETAKTTESTSNTKNETAGWKTYTNEQYGFEFKYPEDLSVEINQGRIEVGDHEKHDFEYYATGSGMMWVTMQFTLAMGSSGYWYEPSEDRLVSQADIQVSGLNVTTYVVDTVYGASFEAQFEHANQKFYAQGFNQDLSKEILKTFKFTK